MMFFKIQEKFNFLLNHMPNMLKILEIIFLDKIIRSSFKV